MKQLGVCLKYTAFKKAKSEEEVLLPFFAPIPHFIRGCCMLNCCGINFKASYKFYAAPVNKKYKLRKILFSFCPHCNSAVYKEILSDYEGNYTHKQQLRGAKALEAYQKACFSRLVFFEKVPFGTKTNANWYYGDFQKTRKKDEKGNIEYLQLKRSFCGDKEVIGKAKVIYV